MSGTNASSTKTTGPGGTGRRYLNGILTANALVLGLLGLNGMGLSFTSVSRAGLEQPGANEADEGGRISAAEQRKTMIAQLATLTQKVDRLEGLMARGVPVRVLEMPAGFGSKNESKGDDKSKGEAKGEGKAEVKARPADGGAGKK